MTIVLWTLVGILALNALVAIGFTLWALIVRYRRRRRSLNARVAWGLRPLGPVGVPRLRMGDDRAILRVLSSRLDPAPIGPLPAAALASRGGDRPPGRRLIGIALVAAILCAGTAFASPRARHAVVGALGVVARGFRPDSAQQAGEVIAPGEEGSSFASAGPPSAGSSSGAATEPTRSGVGPGAATPTISEAVGAIGPPASPTTVTAVSGSSTEVDVDWVDVSGEVGYRVERSSDGTDGWAAIATTGEDVTSYDDTGLPSGTTVYYRVVATGAGADSAPSDVVSATTTIDPAPPTTVTAVTASPSQIDVAWADVDGETGYRVERSSEGTGEWITIATTGQGVTSYQDAGLPSGTTFAYRVFATNAGGDSAPSDVVSAATTVGGDEAAP